MESGAENLELLVMMYFLNF